MDKLNEILITIVGILLILPLIGVSQLGSATSGIAAWIIAIIVLVIGIKGLIKK